MPDQRLIAAVIAWAIAVPGRPAGAVDVPFCAEQVISTAADYAQSVFAADVDGDGDTDVLSASMYDDKIAWYENDGASPPGFTKRVISTAGDGGAWSVFATDMDGDGDLDVLSALRDDKIAWHENDGASPPAFTDRIISTAAVRAESVFATDVDGDGDTDVLAASSVAGAIAWYENDGASPPAFTEHVISMMDDSEATSVFAADVDGDGDADVLSLSGSPEGDIGGIRYTTIAWHENDGGSPPGFTERNITSAANLAKSIIAADVDGDGVTDVLSARRRDGKLAWYENRRAGLVHICDGLGAGGDPRAFISPKSKHVGFDTVEILVGEDVSLVEACTASTGGAPPSVIGLMPLGGGLHAVEFDGPIELAEWTTVELAVRSDETCLESTLCFLVAHLPGDLDGNGQTNGNDPTRFGQEFPHGAALLADLNGDGKINLNDATRFGQIWTGTNGEGKNPDGTGAWLGEGLPPRPLCTCP